MKWFVGEEDEEERMQDDSDSSFILHPSSFKMVGLGRFELPTSRLSGVRSNQLSYRPLKADQWPNGFARALRASRFG